MILWTLGNEIHTILQFYNEGHYLVISLFIPTHGTDLLQMSLITLESLLKMIPFMGFCVLLFETKLFWNLMLASNLEWTLILKRKDLKPQHLTDWYSTYPNHHILFTFTYTRFQLSVYGIIFLLLSMTSIKKKSPQKKLSNLESQSVQCICVSYLMGKCCPKLQVFLFGYANDKSVYFKGS